MKQTARLTVVLGGTCLLASVVLAVGNLVTELPRQLADRRERQRSLRLVLPEFRNDPLADAKSFPVRDREGKSAGNVTFYPARDAASGGHLLAFAVAATSGRGYGGEVTILAALKPDGTFIQAMVTAHGETPGLGTRVTDRKRTRSLWKAFAADTDTSLPPAAFLDQFAGRAAADIGAKDFSVVKAPAKAGPREAMAISGATVSSRAVGDALNLVGAAFTEHRDELLGQ
jgi:electron transport complex protein RnfG